MHGKKGFDLGLCNYALGPNKPTCYYDRVDDRMKVEGNDEIDPATCVRLPKRDPGITIKGFIHFYSLHLRHYHPERVEEFDAFIKTHFKTKEGCYLDHEDEGFAKACRELRHSEFPNINYQKNLYGNIATVDLAMRWCEENDIPYDMGKAWLLTLGEDKS